MIDIQKLNKNYKDKSIFNELSITFQNGNIYALVGINGIGKSTLLNSITQSAFKDSGKILIDTIPNDKFDSKYHFFFVPDHKDMFLNLTGIEYISFIIKIYRCNFAHARKQIDDIATQLKIDKVLPTYISSYSLGMKQKLYLTAALISGVPNLILDEPFNGLDPESCILIKHLLRSYCSSSKNMLLYSVHNLDLVSNFSDFIVFIDKNRNIFCKKNTQNIQELEDIFFTDCVI